MYKRSRALRIDTVLVLISLSGISSMSLRWCPGWLKCSGTAWSVLFSMALRCSPNLFLNINWRKLKVDKASNHFPLGDHFVNLEIFYLDLCIDIDRRKVRLITLELASHVLTAPRLSVPKFVIGGERQSHMQVLEMKNLSCCFQLTCGKVKQE